VFDFRYHVASLAAVLLALAVGVLLGVAISGKVSDTQEAAERAVNEQLRRDLENEREQAAAARERGRAAEELVEKAYPALMEGRLAGKRFALLFLGGVEADVRSAVARTLSEADSESPLRLTALELPIEPAALDEFLAGRSELASYSGDDDFGDLGRDLGRELIDGKTELWRAVSSELVEERSGTSGVPVDGAVVVRSWTLAVDSDGAKEDERLASTETLIDGVIDGLASTGLPVVGVEEADIPLDESAIGLYRERGISSVDDVDTTAGRLALALLLAGGEAGHYGVKESASAVAPPIESVPTEPVGN
jgi:hypothetical protein